MKRDRPLTRETGSVEEAIAMPMWSGFADPVALHPPQCSNSVPKLNDRAKAKLIAPLALSGC